MDGILIIQWCFFAFSVPEVKSLKISQYPNVEQFLRHLWGEPHKWGPGWFNCKEHWENMEDFWHNEHNSEQNVAVSSFFRFKNGILWFLSHNENGVLHISQKYLTKCDLVNKKSSISCFPMVSRERINDSLMKFWVEKGYLVMLLIFISISWSFWKDSVSKEDRNSFVLLKIEKSPGLYKKSLAIITSLTSW